MTFIPAANFADILGSLFCFGLFGLFIGVGAWSAVREARFKAGVEIPVEEVPQRVHRTAKRLVPNFEVSKAIVKYRKKNVVRKYELTGHVGDTPMEVEVMPQDKPPFVREIEIIYKPARGRLSGVEVSDVPVEVMQAALDHMDALGCSVQQIDRAKAGRIDDQDAYELKGDWKKGRVEIKVLVSGEVIKVELKFRASPTRYCQKSCSRELKKGGVSC